MQPGGGPSDEAAAELRAVADALLDMMKLAETLPAVDDDEGGDYHYYCDQEGGAA